MQIPSIAYHTARRFGIISLWAIGGGVVGILLPNVFRLSQDHLGSPFYALGAIAISVIVFFSYQTAKLDVEREERRRDRVLTELSKD